MGILAKERLAGESKDVHPSLLGGKTRGLDTAMKGLTKED